MVAVIGAAFGLVDAPEGHPAWQPSWAPVAVLLLAACVAYLLGGLIGRALDGGVEAVEHRLRPIPTGELLAAALGAAAGFVLSLSLAWPVLLFPGRMVTLPLAVLVALVLTAAGARLGRARGGDLLRFVGAAGRWRVSSPAHGAGVKLVDSAALIDGRVLDVCRAGFIEGTLVVPRFVLAEVQGLADAGDELRRARGKRGLDVLAGLQRSAGIALEVPEDDYPELNGVDAKLLAMCRDLGAALVTVDSNLGRVAEVQGIHVLNLHRLADTLRPPVVAGELLEVRVTRPGKEAGQGVGHLEDGTMVVIEGAREHLGEQVRAEVSSILSTPNGRMVFARVTDAP